MIRPKVPKNHDRKFIRLKLSRYEVDAAVRKLGDINSPYDGVEVIWSQLKEASGLMRTEELTK